MIVGIGSTLDCSNSLMNCTAFKVKGLALFARVAIERSLEDLDLGTKPASELALLRVWD